MDGKTLEAALEMTYAASSGKLVPYKKQVLRPRTSTGTDVYTHTPQDVDYDLKCGYLRHVQGGRVGRKGRTHARMHKRTRTRALATHAHACALTRSGAYARMH